MEEKLEETDEENSVTENEVENLREEIQFLQNEAAAGELMKSDPLETLSGRFYPAPKAEETISDEEWEEITGKKSAAKKPVPGFEQSFILNFRGRRRR